MKQNTYHTPVLLTKVIDGLAITSGSKYIDATLGGGGHTREIINRGGIVLGIDQDADALLHVQETFKSEILDLKLRIVQGNFRDIKKIANDNGFETVSGILYDLGVSSNQIDSSGRGFTVRKSEPLDMRMNENNTLTAYDVVNTYTAEELTDIFMRYGEEEKAEKVAQHILDSRRNKKIETTDQLVAVIEEVIKRQGMMHPATRVFQAIRIEVNSELASIKEGISEGIELLCENGRLCVISFHSLEDRIIKQQFDTWERQGVGVIVNKKPIIADEEEIARNPRSRSAKLRVFEKKVASS